MPSTDGVDEASATRGAHFVGELGLQEIYALPRFSTQCMQVIAVFDL